jgi:predicted alpha/beta hydrolase family esterase
MPNAVLVHGMPGRDEYYDAEQPSASNAHWFPWLQKQLLVRDIPAATPEMPDAWRPDYPTWQREFERFDVDAGTLLVGHSCGGGFLVRWLSEHPDVRTGRVVLVAPWLDDEFGEAPGFHDFALDPGLAERTAGLTVFASDNDEASIERSVARLQRDVRGASFRDFPGYGHFTRSALGTDAFPELLASLVD